MASPQEDSENLGCSGTTDLLTETAQSTTTPISVIDYFVVLGFQYDEVISFFSRLRSALHLQKDSGEEVPLMFAPKKKKDESKKKKFHTMRAKDMEAYRVRASVPYKGAELHRFPRVDNPRCPLPGHLWLFAFPTGVILEHYPPPPPRFFVNALTQSDGTRSYLVCIKFFEQTKFARDDLKLSRQELTLERNMLFAPKAICIMSSFPLFSFFKKYLGDMFMICQDPDRTWTIPMEGYIAQLTLPIPFTFSDTIAFQHLHRLVFTVGDGTVACSLPDLLSDFSIADVSFRYLFQALDLQNFVVLLGAVLTEQKILVASRHYVLLISVMETVINLLSPFEWPHTYIPILPLTLLDFVDAPTPFIIGVHSDTLASLEETRDLQDLVIINCDANTVKVPSYFIPFPDDVTEEYTSSLGRTLDKFGVSMKSKDFIEAEMEKIDLVFAMRAAEYESSTQDAEFTLELRVITTSLFVSFFGDYSRYHTEGERFDEDSFLAAAADHHKDFVQEVMIRNLFEMFLSAGCKRAVFQLILKLYAEHEGDTDAIVGAVEALRGSMKVEERQVDDPAPHSSIISYTQFPELSYSNYPGGDELAPAPAQAGESAMMQNRMRAMIAAKKITNEKELIILEFCFIVLSDLQAGNANHDQVNRMCDWLRGVAVAEGAPQQRETKYNQAMRKINKTLRKLGKKSKKQQEAAEQDDDANAETHSSSTEDGTSTFDDSLVSRTHLMNLLEMWCQANATEFAREPFGRLVKLLVNVVEECHERLPFYLPPDPSPHDNAWNVDAPVRAPSQSGLLGTGSAGGGGGAGGGGDAELYFSVDSDDEDGGNKRTSRSAPGSPRAAREGEVARSTILAPAPKFIDFLNVIPSLSDKVRTEYELLRRLVLLAQKLHYRGEGALINHYAIEDLRDITSVWDRLGFWEYFVCADAANKYRRNLKSAIEVEANVFSVVATVVDIMASLHLKLGVISSLVSRTRLSAENKSTLGAVAARLHMERDAARRLSEVGIEAPRIARTRRGDNMPRDSGATLRSIKNKWDNMREKKKDSRKQERKSRSLSETDLLSLLPEGQSQKDLAARVARAKEANDTAELELAMQEEAKINYVSFLGQDGEPQKVGAAPPPHHSSEDGSSDSIIIVHETSPRGATAPEDLNALLMDVLNSDEEEEKEKEEGKQQEGDGPPKAATNRRLSVSSPIEQIPPALPPKTAAIRQAANKKYYSKSSGAVISEPSPQLPPKPRVSIAKKPKRISRASSPTTKQMKVKQAQEELMRAAELLEIQRAKEEEEMAAFLADTPTVEVETDLAVEDKSEVEAELEAEPVGVDAVDVEDDISAQGDIHDEEALAEAHLLQVLQTELSLTSVVEEDEEEVQQQQQQQDNAEKSAEVDETPPAASSPNSDLPVRVDGVAIVEHPWSARDDDELELLVGDEIKLIKRHHSGWWLGSVNGRKGLFPVEYCRVVLISEVI